MKDDRPPRRPVRAALALAGGGSLGTYISGAVREVIHALRQHNAALRTGAPDSDPRLLNPRWGRVTIDAIGGSSAGALCGAQVARALFAPAYLGMAPGWVPGREPSSPGLAVDPVNEVPTAEEIGRAGTITGDWIQGADLRRLSIRGNVPSASGPIEAPGWTVLSGARLFDLARQAIQPDTPVDDPDSPLCSTGILGIAITLTDLLGYHQPADFAGRRVLGHTSFGAPLPAESLVASLGGREMHDLGGKGHAEVRRLFVARDDAALEAIQRFLRDTHRRGRARGMRWSDEAADMLAGLATASAALPVAIGPVALTDRAAENDTTCRRLYMDGGILNNRPVSPALRMARWHDALRLYLSEQDGRPFDPARTLDQLVYERVCFFVDAFPERCRDDWRSPHPDQALAGDEALQLTPRAVEARDRRIAHAISAPTSAMDVLFESFLVSMRAQDIREIAKTNQLLFNRRQFIRERIRNPPPSVDFVVDSVDKAEAWAAVMSEPGADTLNEQQALAIAERLWESDRLSGLAGRREVTMIPVFAPENLRDVFAGDALYALGGLLSPDARIHDARVGVIVARHVLRAIRRPDRATVPVHLPRAPRDALPDDSSVLVDRLRIAAMAALDTPLARWPTLRFLAKLPMHIDPLVRLAKEKLDLEAAGPENDDR